MAENDFNAEYQKHKLVLKNWRIQFHSNKGRIPSKDDIKEAPSNIRFSYKMYYKLKMSLLNSTLRDVLEDEDGFDISAINTQPASNTDNPINSPALLSLTQNKITHVPTKTDVNIKTSSSQKKPHERELNKKSLNSQMFEKSSFSIRNPRKSSSRLGSITNSKNKNALTSMASNSSSLPDLETILAEKSQKIFQLDAKPNTLKNSSSLDNKIDKQWLDRCAVDSDIDGIKHASTNEPVVVSTFGLGNINSDALKQTDWNTDSKTDDFDEVIENSEDENEVQERVTIRKIIKKIEHVRPNKTVAKRSFDDMQLDNEKIQLKEKAETVNKSAQENIVPSNIGDIVKDDNTIKMDKNSSPLSDDLDVPLKIKKSKATSKVAKSKAPASRKKTSIKTTKIKTIRRVSKSTIKEDVVESEEKYVPEFGIKSLTSKPRINDEEIKKKNMLFDKFVHGVDQENKIEKIKPSKVNDRMEKRMRAGTLNENYVQINLRKKVFVRGKKGINMNRYKRNMYAKRKKVNALAGPDMNMGGCDGGVMTCFQCGLPGHFAQNCKVKGDNLLPIDSQNDDSAFPTLLEASDMVRAANHLKQGRSAGPLPNHTSVEARREEGVSNDDCMDSDSEELLNQVFDKQYIGHEIPQAFLEEAGLLNQDSGQEGGVEPLYKLDAEGNVPEATLEVYEALKKFGHSNFRKGQDRAIMRVLCGLSTLVTLSTGSGKSLCYQLPAYLYSKSKKCITLVISPLVSLMEDQVIGVPNFINAQCLHTNQTPKTRENVKEMIRNGEVDILLISPEAIVAGEKNSGFGALLRDLPPIAFVCIDEAHCVSQWSHNFRPSYLMICQVLREKLGVKTILGLTATATLPAKESIVKHLGIADGVSGVIADIPLPDNLLLSVSSDENKDRALIQLLREERFSKCSSIIIYCTRREECVRIATYIRTCFQDSAPTVELVGKKRKRSSWIAEPYHAGLPASKRRTIQNAFMNDELRIVVATVAFGMGINKSDIQAVIHFNMPKNFESYVQEVGRAGRDGKPAFCHLFLGKDGKDEHELRRHVFANSIDRHVIRKLIKKVFVSCSCETTMQISENKNKRICPGHEVCFSINDTVLELDIPEENIATLLCYLELQEQRYIKVLNRAYSKCKIISYGGTKHLKNAAKNSPPLAMAIAMDLNNGICHNKSTIIEFSVVDVAAAIGWDSGVVKYQLKQLEWTRENDKPKRTNISVNFEDLGFRVHAPGDLTDEELDLALEFLYERVIRQENKELFHLQSIFDGMMSISRPSYSSSDCLIESSNALKHIIRSYFKKEACDESIVLRDDEGDDTNYQIIHDVHAMISQYPENNFSGRSLARIFYGVQSPNFPAVTWGRCKYWRAHIHTSFNKLIRIANAEIVKSRM